jgi:predicted ATPase
MKKYALCGAHGTGKTTILKDLENDLILGHDVSPIFNTSNARKLFEMGVKINDSGDDFVQYVVQASHVSRFAEKNWFADRCVIDGFAYMEAAWRKNLVSSKCWYIVHELMDAFIPLYTQIFYIPIEFQMEDDGIRKVDTAYQEEIDRYIKHVIKKCNNVTIITGSREERRAKILENLETNNQ